MHATTTTPYVKKVGHTQGTKSGITTGRKFKSGMRKRKLSMYEKGRTCGREGCVSILSMYNKADFCFVHQERKPPRIRGKLKTRSYNDDVR